jgi:hypothetical protein
LNHTYNQALKHLEKHAMAWLDTGEDILHLLRGSYGEGAPPPPPLSAALSDLLLLIVICGILITILIAGPMHLWRDRHTGRARDVTAG